MAKMFFCVLLTFVLYGFDCSAAPYSNADEQQEIIEEEVAGEAPDFESKNIVPAKVLALPQTKKSKKQTFDSSGYFFPYTQSISLRSGLFIDVNEITDQPDVNYILGVNYMFPSYYSPQWEVGVDMASTGNGHLNAGMKITLNEKGAYRPFYKIGVIHQWDPDERLASFTDWENYMLLASIGFEDVTKPPKSVRLEIETAINAEEILLMFVAGASWGF